MLPGLCGHGRAEHRPVVRSSVEGRRSQEERAERERKGWVEADQSSMLPRYPDRVGVHPPNTGLRPLSSVVMTLLLTKKIKTKKMFILQYCVL